MSSLRLDSVRRGGATICIRALESLDSDFPLEAARRWRRRRGRGGVEGSKERAKSEVDALSVSPRKERERREGESEGGRERESGRSIEPLDRAGYNIFFI